MAKAKNEPSKGDDKVQDKSGAGTFDTVTVSEQVLVQTPARALKFITAVNRSTPIRAALERRGLSPAVRRAGWELLRVASGSHPDHESAQDLDSAVRDATAALDAQDEDLIVTVRASLQHAFPAQATFVLASVEAARGPEAVLGVETVLDRLDALQDGKARAKTRAADRGALARLAERGYTAEKRKELRELVNTARGIGTKTAKESGYYDAAEAAAAEHASYLKALRALRVWYEEWSDLARVAIKRRDHLVRLGLAQQKRPVKGGGGGTSGGKGGEAPAAK